MRVFGSQCYAHAAKATRRKLDNSDVRCPMLRYSTQHKAYRLLDASAGAIVISRTVTFVKHVPTIVARKQCAPSVIDIAGDEEHDQEPCNTTARKSSQIPPMEPSVTPTHVIRELTKRPGGAVPTQGSSMPGRNSENKSHVQSVRK